jgi:hypothetical protein
MAASVDENGYEKYLFKVIELLGPDGCSSEESGTENGQIVYRQKQMPWRSRWIRQIYKNVDAQITNEAKVIGPRPGNPGGKREEGGKH